jgi:hypothetical protein
MPGKIFKTIFIVEVLSEKPLIEEDFRYDIVNNSFSLKETEKFEPSVEISKEDIDGYEDIIKAVDKKKLYELKRQMLNCVGRNGDIYSFMLNDKDIELLGNIKSELLLKFATKVKSGYDARYNAMHIIPILSPDDALKAFKAQIEDYDEFESSSSMTIKKLFDTLPDEVKKKAIQFLLKKHVVVPVDVVAAYEVEVLKEELLTIDLANNLIGKTVKYSYDDFNSGKGTFTILGVEMEENPKNGIVGQLVVKENGKEHKYYYFLSEGRGGTKNVASRGSGSERIKIHYK